MHSYRLILDGARSASANMAMDEAILRACADGLVPPTLRIYSWEKPAVSLGSLQKIDPAALDLDYCQDAGIEVVRRITGGRAVVHGWDVTFSISLLQSHLPRESRSVLASHHYLMGGILEGLRLFGVQAQIGPGAGAQPPQRGADCFAHIAECDIRVGREKVVGSAQVRKWGALLEQGSIPYATPEIDLTRIFGGRSPDLVSRAFLTPEASIEMLREALARGFGEYLGLQLSAEPLTKHEHELALELEREKYSKAVTPLS